MIIVSLIHLNKPACEYEYVGSSISQQTAPDKDPHAGRHNVATGDEFLCLLTVGLRNNVLK